MKPIKRNVMIKLKERLNIRTREFLFPLDSIFVDLRLKQNGGLLSTI